MTSTSSQDKVAFVYLYFAKEREIDVVSRLGFLEDGLIWVRLLWKY